MVVVNMDLPESCGKCPAFTTKACDKWEHHKTYTDQLTKRHKECPIIGKFVGKVEEPNEDGMLKWKIGVNVLSEFGIRVMFGATEEQE